MSAGTPALFGARAAGLHLVAPTRGVSGVLLYGMPGGGKTACATELAYTHEHAFDRLVWFKAPDEGQDITGALTDFALTLERRLPGFQMVHVLKIGIPAALWPAISLRWWLADVVAGARGDKAATARAREYIEEAAKDPSLSALAAVTGRILDGERDPALAAGLDDSTERAVVITVLRHIGS